MGLSISLEERGFTTVGALRAALVDLGREAFVESFLQGRPTLVVNEDAQGSAPESVDPDLLFQQTHEEEAEDFQAIYRGAAGLLRKRPGSPFPDMINLGRAANCDLVLFLPSISKLHAYFQAGPAGWSVVDSRSRNGTFVNGERLETGAPRLLQDGDALRFGKSTLRLRYRTPPGLCAALRLLV